MALVETIYLVGHGLDIRWESLNLIALMGQSGERRLGTWRPTDTLMTTDLHSPGMDLTHDDIAGIVDLFGALPESELRRGIEELAFRRGEDLDSTAVQDLIDDAKEDFSLAEVPMDDEELLVSGPSAFSTLPEGAEDLPHILDVPRRSPSQTKLESAVRTRLAREAADISNPERAAELVDVTYDAEAWAGIDLKDVRQRLESIAADPG